MRVMRLRFSSRLFRLFSFPMMIAGWSQRKASFSWKLSQRQFSMGVSYNWRMLSTWFDGETFWLCILSLLANTCLIFLLLVFLHSPGIAVISTRCCCFYSPLDNLYCMLWRALTSISCGWFCQRFSYTSSSHNNIGHCSFKSSSCCELFWVLFTCIFNN